jgi:hypothetical protein
MRPAGRTYENGGRAFRRSFEYMAENHPIPHLPSQQPPLGHEGTEGPGDGDFMLTAKVERSFSRFPEPQAGHDGFSSDERTSASNVYPQSLHRYSYNAMGFSFVKE